MNERTVGRSADRSPNVWKAAFSRVVTPRRNSDTWTHEARLIVRYTRDPCCPIPARHTLLLSQESFTEPGCPVLAKFEIVTGKCPRSRVLDASYVHALIDADNDDNAR